MSPFEWGVFSAKARQAIATSDARINIFEGAVRSGKTVSSIVRWLGYVGAGPPGDLLMVSKTERTLKRNILDPIEKMVGSSRFKHNRGMGEITLLGRRIYVAGASDERSEGKIRGLTLAGAYGDEISLWPESFFTMLLSRLSVRGAKFFGTTNPDGPYHWLKRDYIDRAGELDLRSFGFTLEDNLNLDPSYVEALKREYTGLWYKRFVLGQWVMAEGAIYDMFNPEIHVVKVLPHSFERYVVGCDYGTANATCFILLGLSKGIWYALREYYYDSRQSGRQKTDAEYSRDMVRFLSGIKPQAIEVDPSAASFIMQLKRDSVGHIYQADNEVLEGIQVVSQALEDKKLLIHVSCKHLISQLATYSWDPAASKRGGDKPLKQNDHATDALRYASMRAIKRGVFAAPISIQQESHWRGLADYYT